MNQRLFGVRTFEHPADIEQLEAYFWRDTKGSFDIVTDKVTTDEVVTDEVIKEYSAAPIVPVAPLTVPLTKSRSLRLPPDTLFWNIFIAVHGEAEFLRIGSKFSNREWEEKNQIRTTFMNSPKKLQTTNQKLTLGAVKEMMSEYMTGGKTTLLGVIGMSVYYGMSITLVDLEKKTHLAFIPENTERDPCVLIRRQGKTHHLYEMGDESHLTDTFGLEHYTRPLRAISTYKRAELDELATQYKLCDKSKQDQYQALSAHLVWKV
jgi:hypothetical protein